MQQLKIILLPILLGNPFRNYEISILNTFNEYNQNNLSAGPQDDYFSYFKSNRTLPVVLVNNKNNQENNLLADEGNYDEYEETEIQLVSDLRDILLPKAGTTLTQKTESRRRGGSRQRSTLVFRQETTSRRGEPSSATDRSSATHPENVANFEKAGIPIDPVKNPNKKPDNIQNWRWDRSQQKWIIHGERMVKIGNKITTEKKWQSMLINHSRQA